MTKREVIKCVLDGKKPPYVPWSFKFTKEPKEELMNYYATDDLDPVLGNHTCSSERLGFFEVWGTIWSEMFSA